MSGNKLVIKKLDLDLQKLTKKNVYVGYPEGPHHADSKLTNAELAFLMTTGVQKKVSPQDIYLASQGDPAHRIPPRPFVEPGIEKAKERISDYLVKAISADLDKDSATADQNRTLAGMAGVNAVRKFIRDYPANGLTPNAPSTIRRKGEDHPLKGRTGELMRSITSVVRND